MEEDLLKRIHTEHFDWCIPYEQIVEDIEEQQEPEPQRSLPNWWQFIGILGGLICLADLILLLFK